MTVIQKHLGDSFLDWEAYKALAASLVHDLGHGPFSHAFEDVGRRLGLKLANHELVSDALIRDSEVSSVLQDLSSGFPNDVADIIKSPKPGNIYAAVVSSQFDADRLDYMQRDRAMAGTRLSQIDFDWLIANLEVGALPYGVDEEKVGTIETFVLGPKAMYAAEAYVLGLFQLYPTIYFHKATRSAEKLFTELLTQAISLVRAGKENAIGLPPNHPLVKFAKEPESIKWVLQLDDTVVWGALSMMTDAADPTISQFARRLRDRKLFKCIDLRTEVGREILDQVKVEQICTAITTKIEQWKQKSKINSVRILVDRATREPYKQFQESKGPLNQIMIRHDQQLVDLGRRSRIVKAIEPFQLLRAYTAPDDTDAQQFLLKTIKAETTHATTPLFTN
jgi:HD superfamily phosphohydrolase